ncbi:D-amino-acid oxidase [Kluyveromyces marxianus]|nr:D-amino-acid oxidase [Kluyveromyces marxianus]
MGKKVQPEVTIVGAGISGLYVSYCLTELYGIAGDNICVVGDYLPGDSSANGYTSPWAGGNFSCISPSDENTLWYDKFTYQNLGALSKALLAHFKGKDGEWLGLARRPSSEYWDYDPPKTKIDSLRSYLENFRVYSKDELAKIKPSPPAFGITFKTWNFNCPVFLVNLATFLKEKHNVSFVKAKLTHIAQAKSYTNDKCSGSNGKHIIINCSGLGAKHIGGVADHNMYPTRGQVVVAAAPHVAENCLRWGKDYATYIIPRPGPLHELVLGGFLQVDNWNAQDTSKEETDDILQRTTTLLPKIGKPESVAVLKVAAGLRPSRHGGPRVEREDFDDDGHLVVVHNYGASGYGYQSGLGLAFKAVSLALKGDRSSKL